MLESVDELHPHDRRHAKLVSLDSPGRVGPGEFKRPWRLSLVNDTLWVLVGLEGAAAHELDAHDPEVVAQDGAEPGQPVLFVDAHAGQAKVRLLAISALDTTGNSPDFGVKEYCNVTDTVT